MSKLIALSLLFLSAHAASAHEGVTATLTLAAPDTLTIEYDLPGSCKALPFVNAGIRDDAAAAMRANWKASDACGTLDSRAVRRADASCKALRFSVPASTEKLDRVYQWAYPIGGGVYSHTSAFAVDTSCGPVSWRFKAPGGTVIFDGAPLSDSTAQSGDINYKPVIFLGAALAGGAATRSYVDPRLSGATSALVSDAVIRSFALYSASLPGVETTRGFVAISVSPNARSWGGDVAAQSTIHLTVPAVLPAPMETDVRGFVAHEVGHMYQPREWHDAWSADRDMLSEGGADFLMWMAQSELGWANSIDLKLRLEKAINGCMIAAAGRSWKSIKERGWGRAPYDCGFTFHVLGLAARSTNAPVWLVMRDYYQAARKGATTDFSTALECAGKAGCNARWLNRIAGDEPVAAVLSAYAGTGSFLKIADGSAPGMIEPVMRNLIGRLMAIDCNGQVSLYDNPGRTLIGPVNSCKSLRQNMEIVAAEGQPLFAGPAATRAVFGACASKGAAKFSLKDGTELELACDSARVGAMPALFEVDMVVLRKRLGMGPNATIASGKPTPPTAM